MNNNESKKSMLSKFEFHLKSKFDGIEIRAKLLETPCLKAAYLIRNVELNAKLSNERSELSCNLNSHCLSFQCDDEQPPTNTTNQPTFVIVTSPDAADERKSHYRATRTTARSLEDRLPPLSGESSSSSPFLTMRPLEERTNFFLPSVSLTGTHFLKHVI